MDGLEFPDLHHQILHQLATTLAHRPDPLADQRINHLWNQFPPLPARSASPENDEAPGSPNRATAAPPSHEPASKPDRVSAAVLTARQQNALLAGARCALETKSSDTRRALMARLLPYLEALPYYVFPENHRWKEVSPEDRFVYEFVSYILNVAADEMHQSGASTGHEPPSKPIATAVLDGVWAYLAAHVRMVCDDDSPRVCTFVLPSLNGLLQALEDTALPFPWTWVVQVYDLAKVLLHATCLDQITQKIAAVQRGPGRRSAPPTETPNYHDRSNGTVLSNASDTGAWRYARQVLKKYQAAGTPFSSNSVVTRYLGLVRNVLVRQCVQPLTAQSHRLNLMSPRMPASIATGSDSRTASSRPADANSRAPDGSTAGESGDRGNSPRITSRGRQASVAHAAVSNLDSAVDPESHYRSKALREHLATVAKSVDDEAPTSPMGTYEDCWALLKTTVHPIGNQLTGPLADAPEPATTAQTDSSGSAPLLIKPDNEHLISSTNHSMPKLNGMPVRTEYMRAVRGLFVLSQRYWRDIVEVMRETETAQPANGPTTASTNLGPGAGSSSGLAGNDPGSPSRRSASGASGINWTAQVSQQSSPPTPTPAKWYLTPELYVLDLLPRCLHIAALACIELAHLDEPFLNATQLFLLSSLARQCPVVFIAVCDVLEVLAVHFPDYRAEILQCAIDYANYPPKNTAEVVADPAGMEKNPSEVALDDDLLGYVVQVLTRCLALHEGGDEYTLSTLHLFMNTLFSTHWEMHRAPLAHRLCRNAVLTMCDIALALNRDRITVWCVSTMLRAAKKDDVSLRRLIIERLAPVALIAPPTSFHEIIELLVHVAANRSTNVGVEQHLLRETVWQTIRYLAVHANQRPDLYNRFLIGMLQWFVDRGVDIQSTTVAVRTKGVIHAKELGVFLPVIQALLEHRDFQPHLKPTHDTVSSMRNVWFCLVIHGCLVDPSWIEEYNDALVVMAAKSPILVHESAVNYLETDLEYNSILRRSYTEQSLTSLRQTLATYLPQHAPVIRALSFAQTTFLLAVWYIETTRGRAGNCTQILRYFENTGVTSSRLVGLIEAIAEKTIQEYVQERKFQHSSAIVNEEMKSQLRALLISSCNRLERISRLSRTFTKTILISYPQALLDRQLLFTLLELVQLLWESCQAEIEDEFYPVYSFSSPVLGITLLLPDSMSYRKTLLASFMVAARDWLLLATKAAPLEMEGLLQDYLARSDNTATGFRPHVGRSLALDVGRSLYAAVSGTLSSTIIGSDSATALLETTADPDDPVASLGTSLGWSLFTVDAASGFLFRFGRHMFYQGEQHGWSSKTDQTQANHSVLEDLQGLYRRARQGEALTVDTLYPVLCQAAALAKTPSASRHDVLKLLCWLPVHVFTHDVMKAAITVWTGVIIDQPELEPVIIAELVACWTWTIRHRRGLFAERYSPRNPFCSKMSYAPSDITARHRAYKSISHAFNPHVTWILFLTARVDATQFHHPDTALLMIRFFQLTFPHVAHLNTNSLARQGRFLLVRLGLKLLEGFFASPIVEFQFRKHVYHLALAWFVTPPRWTFSGNKRSISEELRLLMDCYYRVEADLQTESTAGQHVQWIGSDHVPTARGSMAEPDNGRELQSSELPSPFTRFRLKCQKRLLLILLASEIRRMATWNSASDSSQVLKDTAPFKENMLPDDVWRQVVREAWDYDPRVAVYLPARTSHPAVKQTLTQLVMRYPQAVVNIPEALDYLLPHSADLTVQQRKHLLYWAPVAPVTATSYLTRAHSSQPLVVQYAMRSLAHYPIDVVFFYVPQLVQALRYDHLGYVERYIFDAAQISPLFAHQIIWNMKANMYKDEDSKIPDTLKPTLDRMIDRIVASLSGENQAFYEREFAFFGRVTGISGTLKPFIKKPKEEKKKKIDEEMRKIPVDVGVYLPSNPDGEVVDIDYNSGRPLQSHAKAPFMATFYVRRQISTTDEVQELIDDHTSEKSYPLPSGSDPSSAASNDVDHRESGMPSITRSRTASGERQTLTMSPISRQTTQRQDLRAAQAIVKQAAIFKVGDDCRQDVLALQLIAIFKNIFTSVGLDLYLFPYRVVATAPGCGMIDVIPNSISRDQLGREKVNSLYDYFLTKYGGEDSVSYQKARHAFVQSVAAYSLISFLLQIKDRHNGNIMLDDRGHVIHIDFGFILDIAPGGINFESSPFKLTTEMINVMGGSATAQPFKLFADLCVKAYLASRPYADLIIQVVQLMMDSGLPCFKGGSTLAKLRQRFQLDMSDREAAQYMLDRIHDSYQNRRTVLYDSFQKATNGIPY